MKTKLMMSAMALLSICAAQSAMAQRTTSKAKVTWGPEIKAPRSSTLQDIFAVENDAFYAMRSEKSSSLLEKYDLNCKQLLSVELELSHDKKKHGLEEIIHIGDEIYLFSSFENKKEEKNYLFVETINKKTLVPGNMKKIAEIDYAGQKRWNSGSYSFKTSSDSSHIMIFFDKPHEKEGTDKFGFQIYNSKMELQWESDIDSKYEDELFTVSQRSIDQNGNVYILGRLFKDKVKERVKDKPNYTYRIICYSKGGKEKYDYELKLDDLFLSELTFRIAENGDLICAGFYSESGTSRIQGVYYLAIDATTLTPKTSSKKEFELDFFMQTLTEKETKKAQKKVEKGKDLDLYEYNLDNLILREDGGAVLVGEQFFIRVVTTHTSSPNGGTTTQTTYHYYYNNLIVINISPAGQIDWSIQIPKRQHSTNDGGYFSSYAMAIVGSKLYFVFNDNEKNLYIKDGERIENYSSGKSSMVVLVTVDQYGEWEKEGIFSKQEVEIMTVPKTCEQITKNQMVIFGDWKKSQKFAKVDFE